MHKGRLLASICAVGLLAAAPAVAAETATTPDTGTNAPPTDTGNAPPAETGTNHPAMHHGAHHAMRHTMHHMAKGAGSGKSDTSQNAAVEDLNQQSLQAAREGHDLSMGGAAGSAPAAPGEAPPGAMGGPGPGPGAPPAPAPAAGGGKM